jgi:Putative peptidoglycan binding domain
VPERAIAVDSAEFEDEGSLRALLRRALGRNPLDVVGIFVLLVAAGAILINALYRQPGPHPAPIFSIKPRPVAGEPVGGVVPVLPRARPEGLVTAKPEASSRSHADVRPEAAAAKAPARLDPIAELIAPAPRVTAVQRALNDFGYGPVKVTGNYGPETVAAIQKFERDRKLQVTGQISPRLLRELAAATGRPLE